MNLDVQTWLPAEFFRENRRKFMEQMVQGSIAVFHAAQPVIASADLFHHFIQAPNFFYLTGIEAPDCVLMLHPASRNEERETLFIPKPDPQREIWTGRMLDKDEVSEISGVDKVQYMDDFEGKFVREQQPLEYLYTDYEDEGFRYPTSESGEFRRKVQNELPGLRIKKANPILADLRRIKSPQEISLIRRAVEITGEALQAVWTECRSDRWEYQLEAVIAYHFISNGARKYAFAPIMASGASSTVLHYVANESQLEDGEVLLTDVGAKFLHYCADITRTVPVNSRFSGRQRDVYQAVLEVQRALIQSVKPGIHVDELNATARDLIGEKLIDLELVGETEEVNEYYMHRVSHFLGLDAHDVGTYTGVLEPGCVLTIEPGIYIREEGLGVRIEDDLLVTEEGCEVLSAGIAKEPSELEALVHG
ncbi:MAG TPA: aminopeptidase P N-terminal domain-containing protein [bacterium]|nr:aminopeptidase P N-terminal domain-containing protein [bacterium]